MRLICEYVLAQYDDEEMKTPATENRWTSELVAAIEQVLACPRPDMEQLAKVAGFTHSNGVRRIDLRGYPFGRKYDCSTLSEVDLTGCEWNNQSFFTALNASDCVLRQMRIEGVLASNFVRCDFATTTFVHCQTLPGASFKACNFGNCRFVRGSFFRTEFDNCRFVACRMPDSEFLECTFRICTFAESKFDRGSFGRSRFKSHRDNLTYKNLEDMSPMEHLADASSPTVDLGETNMIGVTFT